MLMALSWRDACAGVTPRKGIFAFVERHEHIYAFSSALTMQRPEATYPVEEITEK